MAETCELHSESQSQERATEMESDINVRGAVLGCKHVNCIQRANHRKGQLKRKHINVRGAVVGRKHVNSIQRANHRNGQLKRKQRFERRAVDGCKHVDPNTEKGN